MQISLQPVTEFFPEFSVETLEKLHTFCRLLLEKNQSVNLISRKNTEALVEQHLLPSLAISRLMPMDPGSSALDIGSGGGFPGLVLAIVQPNIQWTLLDSIGKKIRALEEFVLQLDLHNVTCINNRAEHLQQRYHYVTGRAVTSVEAFEHLAQPLTKGKIGYLTGGDCRASSRRKVFDLYTFFQEKYCETKKLLVIS